MSEPLILIGDPTSDILHPLKIKLHEFGYAIMVAENSAVALEMMQTTMPKAVFVDIATPELKGILVCRAIRSTYPVITLIALNQGEAVLRQEALSAGASLVLDMPVNWADIRNWLHAPQAANGQVMAEGSLHGQTLEQVIGSVSLLAHDLKSPISVIISSLEVLMTFQEEDGVPETTKRLVQGALNAAYRQLNMVSNVVDLARLETDCYDLQLIEFDLADLIRERLEAEAYALEIKGLVMKISLPDEPLLVTADYELMQRVISALIDSVIKFTVRNDELHICAQREQERIVMCFKDTGRPIDRGFERDIMTRAPQWERRQSGARTSVGLSLPFVYEAAKAHQGDFTVQSEGKYTIFTITLPA